MAGPDIACKTEFVNLL